jgi:hypothetical protein
MTITTRQLTLETEAASRLKERLREQFGDDTELLRDVIEGNFSFENLINACTEELAAIDGIITGISGAMVTLSNRKDRYERQMDTIRTAIEEAMTVSEQRKVVTPVATLSIRKGSASVRVTDEAEIPDQFWIEQDPRLNKRKLKDALEDGENIPGAELSNGPDSLAVKFT